MLRSLRLWCSTVRGSMSLLTHFVEAEKYGRLYTGGKGQASRSGSLIACVCGAEVNLVDLATGKIILTVPSDADEFTAFALRDDGRQLTVCSIGALDPRSARTATR